MPRILLVDDDPALQRIYAAALPLAGFVHIPAGSGEEALATLDALPRPPEALVVDMHLPGIHGLELLRRLRARPAWTSIPAILFTIAPQIDLQTAAAALRAEVRDKSLVGPARMLAELNQLLGRGETRATVALPTTTPFGSLAALEARAREAGAGAHRATAMLQAATLGLAAQLHLADLRQHPAALGGLAAAVDLLHEAVRDPSRLGAESALAAAADDDRGTRALVHSALRKYGMAVAEFVDGEALLEGVRGAACDVVVTDIVMPRRSGVAVVTALRHERPDIPILVVTSMPAERQPFAARYRPDEVVVKPFLLAELAMKAWFHVVRTRLGAAAPPVRSRGTPEDPWALAR